MASIEDVPNCGSASNESTHNGLRIASIFIILATSSAGTLFPIVAKRATNIPRAAFDFVKYFGSGVIIATAFIHLLAPAFEALSSPCLSGAWTVYPWAPAFTMMSVFGIFFVELFAFRLGSRIIARSGTSYDVHAIPHSHMHKGKAKKHMQGQGHGHSDSHAGHDHSTHGEKSLDATSSEGRSPSVLHDPTTIDIERQTTMGGGGGGREEEPVSREHAEHEDGSESLAQIVGIAILEFGVIFHSVIIGLTLAVDEDFKTLFIVILFHQMFEGLGLGSRLAYLELPKTWSRYVPYVGAILYSIMTPIGIAIGLGVRTTYNPESATANIVSGVLDAISAGILLYTGLVELLAHEFLFNPKMHAAPTSKILYASFCILLGAGIMALLGRWA